MRYHGSVVPIKIYPLRHDESFHSSLLLFLFDWLLKRWEITKVVLIIVMASSYYVTQVAKCTWIWLSVSQPLKLLSAMLISPCSDWNHKLHASHRHFMYAFLGCYLAIQPPLKLLPGACDVTSFSPCTDSNHELRDLQHLTYTFLKRLQLLLV